MPGIKIETAAGRGDRFLLGEYKWGRVIKYSSGERKGRSEAGVSHEATKGERQGLPLWLSFHQAWGKGRAEGEGQEKCKK